MHCGDEAWEEGLWSWQKQGSWLKASCECFPLTEQGRTEDRRNRVRVNLITGQPQRVWASYMWYRRDPDAGGIRDITYVTAEKRFWLFHWLLWEKYSVCSQHGDDKWSRWQLMNYNYLRAIVLFSSQVYVLLTFPFLLLLIRLNVETTHKSSEREREIHNVAFSRSVLLELNLSRLWPRTLKRSLFSIKSQAVFLLWLLWSLKAAKHNKNWRDKGHQCRRLASLMHCNKMLH